MADHENSLSRRNVIRLTGAAGVAGLAGCGGDGGDGGGGDGGDGGDGGTSTDGGDSTATEQAALEIVHWWTAGGEQDAIEALISGFEEEHSDIQVENNPAPGGAGSALDTVIKDRVLNQNPPSTFQIWPGRALDPYVEADVLADLGDVWTDEMQEAYQDGVIEMAQRDGTFVSVPLNIHRLNNLFYNVSVVEEAGVDLTSVDSPSALLDSLATISEETDAAPMANQTQSPWSTLQLWEDVLVGEAGVDVYNDVLAGNVSANEEDVRNALQLVADYSEYFNEDSGSVSWDQGNSMVIEGNAATIHQGDWAAGQYKSTEGFEFEDGWNYVPFPGTEGVYHIVSDSFVMPKPNPSPEATRQWLSYAGSTAGQEAFNPIKGSIPPRTDVNTDDFGPFLTQQIDDFGQSDSQPPTIAHGTGVNPEVKSNIEGAFASFLESWDVDSTYNQLTNAFEE